MDRIAFMAGIYRPPLCLVCNKRITNAGKGQGWKCKKCSARSGEPNVQWISRTLETGWY